MRRGPGATVSRWIARAGIGLEVALSGLVARHARAGGHRVTYLETRATRAKGQPAIVMLHGFGGDKLNWVRYARHLSRRYRVIIPDLPGFGDSERRAECVYSTDHQAEWLADLLDALGAPTVHLAGNSMGDTWRRGSPRAFPTVCVP